MKNKYPHIFEPITVRRMTVKNRIVMTPMGTNYGEQNGEMSFLHINYYEQRAKGGTGLIIVENASVDSPQGSNGTTQLRIDLDNYIPRLFKLCESVHKHGACIAIQLNHAGASAMSSRIGMQPVSASDVPSKAGGEIPRPLEKDEIMHIVKKYGEAAKRGRRDFLLQATPHTGGFLFIGDHRMQFIIKQRQSIPFRQQEIGKGLTKISVEDSSQQTIKSFIVDIDVHYLAVYNI